MSNSIRVELGLSSARSSMALLCAGLALIALHLGACATTTQTRSVEKSGFLGDYSMLEEGEGDDALLLYVSDAADWAAYDKIYIESVTIWTSEATKEIGQEDAQILTDHFYGALQEQFAKIMPVVSGPGPGTLKLRAAITGGEDAAVVGNVVTTVVPQLRVLSTLGGMAAKTSVFVGEATIEAEITDSVSGRRVAAGVDRRVGTKTFSGMFSDWADVEGALDYWAERVARRVAEQKSLDFPEA